MAVGPEDVQQARLRIRPHVLRTPMRHLADEGVWLKCENRQRTGSFKLRGALNKILGLPEAEARKGVLAASAGNHGQGVAYAASLRGIEATVVVPADAVEAKVQAIRAMGARVITVAGGYSAAEAEALRMASRQDVTWVSPYNDCLVIAGQGTVGLEIVEDLVGARLEGPTSVYVPASGGGLLAGVAIALKAWAPHMRLVGVQPEACPYLYVHMHGGDMRAVQERPTIADGLSGAVERGSITLDILADLVEDIILVEEGAIEAAIRWADAVAGEVIEPSAAVALAGARQDHREGERLVVLSGGNIDPTLLRRMRAGAVRDG
jgi:threonine dehydratase